MKQDWILKFIEQLQSLDRIPHTWLIEGANPEQVLLNLREKLKITIADEIRLSLEESKKEIGIAEVRRLIAQVYLKPHSSPFKIAAILQADKLSIPAQNALLKTLEEPPAQTLFLLFCRDFHRLLPTILSRAQKISAGINPGLSPEITAEMEKLRKSNLHERFAYAEEIYILPDLDERIISWQLYWRGRLKTDSTAASFIKRLLFAEKALKTNVNRRLLLENLFLELPSANETN